MNKSEARDALMKFVSVNYIIDVADIPQDKSLIDEGIIDSFGLIEVASFLENEFEIKVVEEDFVRENFGSILKIVDFVEAKKAAQV
jgi:acyl carrier protein